jgi:hypothetical protein
MSPHARDLSARVAAVHRYLYRRSALGAAAWTLAGVGVVWVFAWLWSGEAGWRSGSVVPLVLDALVILGLVSGAALFRRAMARSLDEERLAGAMERAVALRRGELRGPLELARALPDGVSMALAAQASQRAVERLGDRADPELAGDLGRVVTRWVRRGSGALVVATLAVVVLTVAQPARSTAAWSGLASPLRVLNGPVLPAMGVSPGNAEVMRGSDVRVEVVAPGRRTVEVRWQQVGDVARTEPLEVVDGRAELVLTGVSAPTDYRATGDDGSTSEEFRITPVDPLFVSALEIDVEFPPHTGLAPEEYRGAAPTLRVPAGTRFGFEGEANRPLESVRLTDGEDDGGFTLEVAGRSFAGRWVPRASGRYTWTFLDAQGGRPEVVPEPLEVELVPDAAPFVDILEPGVDTVLSFDLRQPIGIEAADDYGLARMEIVAYRVTALGERREPARPVLSFQSWGLMPGDEVRYLVRASDNSPAEQWTETREYVLSMPSADELRRGVDEALDAAADRLSELAQAAGEGAEENRQAARERQLGRRDRSQSQETGRSGEASAGFEEREELQRALDEQQEMASTLDSLGRELDQMERRMAEAGQADPEMRAQLRELQSLLEQVGGEDLQARTERLSEALERDDAAAAERSLEELAEEQERFRERLEESLERFRRAAAEQDFRATRTEAEELARQERALAETMREEPGGEMRAEQQQALAERAEDLESQLERLEERLSELGEENAAGGVREAGESARQAAGEMREAERRAGEGSLQDAAERAEQASDRLDEAARELQQAQQSMAQQRMQQAQQALEQAADDALALARRQSELREEMRNASGEQIVEMREREASLVQGVANLAENLRVATEGQIPGAQEISAQMGRAMESLQRTVSAMDRPRSLNGSPYAEAERAVGDLNRLAMMAMAGAEQMGQGGGEGAEQQGQEMQQALEELAQQQGDLVNQAGQIVPMQLGQQAMSEQTQQMSQGQQSISDQLGDLSDQPSSEGALGDLEQLAAEAAELAQALSEGRLDPETVRRQERLFHRLLDAGRSLEREEFSEERESEEAGAVERGSVLPLEEGELGVLPFRMPDAEQLRDLSPGVRRMILDYFERLNRAPGSPGGGR